MCLHRCYDACMSVAITIRNVPQPVRDELASRAARTGRSLQEYLLARLTEMAAKPPIEDVIARSRARVERTASTVSVEAILAAKDADRR